MGGLDLGAGASQSCNIDENTHFFCVYLARQIDFNLTTEQIMIALPINCH